MVVDGNEYWTRLPSSANMLVITSQATGMKPVPIESIEADAGRPTDHPRPQAGDDDDAPADAGDRARAPAATASPASAKLPRIGGLAYGDQSPEGIKLAIDTYIAPLLRRPGCDPHQRGDAALAARSVQGQFLRQVGDRDRAARCPGPAPGPASARAAGRRGARPRCRCSGRSPAATRARRRRGEGHDRGPTPPRLQAQDRPRRPGSQTWRTWHASEAVWAMT